MPSHLTRVVFRSIVANKPLLYRDCLHRPSRSCLVLQNGLPLLPQSQRRTFLNLWKSPRKVKPAELPPGLDKMTELAHRQRVSARLPPPDEVAEAFTAFTARKGVRFEDYHVHTAGNAFRYLQENPHEHGPPWLSRQDIRNAMSRLLDKPPETGGQPHLAFGRLLYQELEKTQEKEGPRTIQESTSPGIDQPEVMGLPMLVRLLSTYGASLEARDIAAKNFVPTAHSRAPHNQGHTAESAWTAVLQGFAQERNVEELVTTAELILELSLPFTVGFQRVLVAFFAERNNLEQAKRWYSQPVVDLANAAETEPAGKTHAAILTACALHGDLTFGQSIVASMLKNTPNKEAWDAVFLWSAAIGKGVDEVERMMNVMVRRSNEAIQPDIDTINTLVEFAMSKKDPYSAERYITLGERRNIFPNERTFAMQMQYRLSISDIDGARAAYFGLQGNMSGDERSVNVVNKLIQVLCESKQHQYDDLMAIVDDLLERKARLAPETVAALCLLHLRRGETHDAADLLNMHAHHFSPPQRVTIRDSLAAFILDGQTSTADAWDAYQLLRKMFPETPREVRIHIMNEFFARKRSDMACHVFFHMRNHTHKSITANKEVYVAAFTGFARNADAESLELVHNQLKLDLSLELDTQLRNALMLAYASTGNNRRALDFWAEICGSREGPSYNSIAIAFRSCEGMPFGDEHAKSIWRRLKEMDVDIDKAIFVAYQSAIARNHQHDEALTLVESVEEEHGFTPDVEILGNWFNTTTNIERQLKVEAWIREQHPAVWSELEALGHWVTMDGFGYRQYNINRDLDP
ncbi:complex I intermediate-associated protein-like protein 84 [Massariosphaeria phaeospora]|uniref:Complex I intermediate-associated protein-like protein 84 n=1 Tax=Massariosphaeria phaeospora TaxID=100035 RepID=A0A7C8MHI9_9PLEO|nr:complex I intermediate-associated protein-like protein 84 [Massariosphaeria phaeospora]